MQVLFIGGPLDGNMITYSDDLKPYYEVPVLKNEEPKDWNTSTYRIERYQLRPLRGSTKTFYVYAMQHLTGDAVMEALLSRYRKEQ